MVRNAHGRVSVYRSASEGPTVPCERCASTVNREDTEYAADGTLRCPSCLPAASRLADPVPKTPAWTLRKGLLMGFLFGVGIAFLSFLVLGDVGFAWVPFAAAVTAGAAFFVHRLRTGRRRSSAGLAIGAVLGFIVFVALLVLYALSTDFGFN